MRDLDSAVGRLDNILMSLYVIIAALIIAVAMVSLYLQFCLGLLGDPLLWATSSHFLFCQHLFCLR